LAAGVASVGEQASALQIARVLQVRILLQDTRGVRALGAGSRVRR
jgi:hypothetical protein